MKSLFNTDDNQEIINRIEKLTPDTPAQWGKMNVSQMLAHCQAPLRVAFGDVKLKRGLIGFLLGGIAKKKLFTEKPWDHNMPTDPTFIRKGEHNFQTEKEQLLTLVRRFAEQGPEAITSDPHPFFGRLNIAEWDTLQVKHLNHHLTQFGV